MEGTEQEAGQETPVSFDELPSKTKAEIRALRKEAADLRATNQALQDEALKARFGEDIISDLPEEVRTYSSRVKLAEVIQGRQAKAQEAIQNEEVEPLGLAALSGPMSANTHARSELPTVAEIRELRKSDPEAAAQIVMSGKYQQQTSWEG